MEIIIKTNSLHVLADCRVDLKREDQTLYKFKYNDYQNIINKKKNNFTHLPSYIKQLSRNQ